MRRGVLARVITFAAVVAEVGEVIQIAGGETLTLLHGGEDGAVAFAIAAGVADAHDTLAFRREISGQHELPHGLRFFRTPFQSSCRIPPDILCQEYCRP